jgi:small subunit ribosomal protein S9
MARKLTKKNTVVKKVVKTVATSKKNAGYEPTPAEAVRTVGRRKTAVARVRLWTGKSDISINGKSLSDYFPTLAFQNVVKQPFGLTETQGKIGGTIKVIGSGLAGQAGAISHGISRALVKLDEKYRPLLKKAGLLTRDSRMKETRKVGQGGKARSKKQSPKR